MIEDQPNSNIISRDENENDYEEFHSFVSFNQLPNDNVEDPLGILSD